MGHHQPCEQRKGPPIVVAMDSTLLNSEPLDLSDIFVFVNPKSGGNRGQVFLEIPSPFLAELEDGQKVTVHIFSLPDGPSGSKPGFLKLKEALQKFQRPLRVIVGGGDGTIMWADQEAVKHGIDSSRQLVYGVIPLGTGNDFARVAGWGGKNPKKILLDDFAEFRMLVSLWVKAKPRLHDVWEVEVRVHEDGEILVVDENKVEVELDFKSKKMLMINYFSIGQESKVGIEFDKHRTKSQTCNLFVYAFEGLFTEMQCCSAQHIGHLVATVYEGTDDSGPVVLTTDAEERSHPNLRGNPESLLFLNVNSYAGGNAHFWRKDSAIGVEPEPHPDKLQSEEDPGDSKLEVVTLPNILLIPIDEWSHKAKRVHSGGPYFIDFYDRDHEEEEIHVYCEVDGEFYHLVNPESFSLHLVKKLKVLQNDPPLQGESVTDHFLQSAKQIFTRGRG